LLAVLDRAATAYGRGDLAAMVRSLADGVVSQAVTVAFVGQHQSGKSSLIDALIGAEVSPVVHGWSTRCTIRVGAGPSLQGWLPEGRSLDLHADEDRSVWTSAITGADAIPAGAQLRVEAPSPLLDDGLVLIDTPGTAGPLGAVSQRLVALPVVDAVVLVTAITQELTADELELAAAVRRSGRPVLVVGTKADLQPAWRSLVERDRSHLQAAGLDIDAIGVSTPVRLLAMATGDDQLDEESGVPVLVDWLYDTVLADLGRHRHRTVVDTGRVVLDALTGRFEAELAALVAADGPADGVVAQPDLTELRRRAREVDEGGGRWSTQLSALLKDAVADVDTDLRRRGLAVLADVDVRLADGDPADDWSGFERWLDERIAAAIGEHLSWRHERLIHAVEQSTASFGQLIALVQTDPAELGVGAAPVRPGYQPARASMGASVYAAVRSSYGGLAMVGFFGGLAGVVLTAPVTLGIGLVLGGKQIRDERAKQVVQRRAQAAAAARTYVDHVWSDFANGSRTQFRTMNTTLRAELAAAVDRLRTDTKVALEAALSAASADAETRGLRRADVNAELGRLRGVRARLEAFA